MRQNKMKKFLAGFVLVACVNGAVMVPTVMASSAVPAADAGVVATAAVTPAVQRLQFDTASELEQELARMDYQWPPRAPVPSVEVGVLPEDLASLPVARKKALFFRSLLPLVLAENQRLREQRAFIKAAFAKWPDLSSADAGRLEQIRQTYRVQGDLHQPEVQATLLRRADVIPPALVLAQAANESGWGTSRFAREANNLFGMWTYNPELGLVPDERAEGARHRVRAYADLRESVRHYMLTLNRVAAYSDLRRLREAQRAAGRGLDAGELAQGLLAYSERGAEYVEEIRRMIRSNRLHELQGVALSAS